MSTSTQPATTTTSRPGAAAPDPGAPTGGTPGWRLVAMREIAVKLRDKAFVFSTLFLVVAVAAGLGISQFMSGRTSSDTVAVVGAEGAAIVEAADRTAQETDANRDLTVREAQDVEQAQDWVLSGEVDAALLPVDPPAADGSQWEVVGGSSVDGGLSSALGDAVAASVLEQNAEAAGTSAAEVTAGTVLGERLLDAGALPEGLLYIASFAFAFLFYMTALTFGIAIAQSVVEEKQSRVVEILVATVPVRQLLAGKVLGNSLLALAQVLLLVGVGLVGLSVTGNADVLSPVLAASGWFVVFFLLGFAALACLWAVAGSVATRQEDLQSTSAPMTFVVMGVLFAGIFSSGTLQTVLSFVPLASTVAMPARMLQGDVPIWQPLVAAALVAVTAVVLVRLGARLYEGSVLQTARRVKLGEAFSRSAS